MNTSHHLIFACSAMVLLCFIVGNRLAFVRFREARSKRIHPQKIQNSTQVAQLLLDSTQTADNFRNLFELPVLFYALCALAVAMRVESPLLVGLAWAFVASRYVHSFIHCTYNRVMHRFGAFVLGMWLLLAGWLSMLLAL